MSNILLVGFENQYAQELLIQIQQSMDPSTKFLFFAKGHPQNTPDCVIIWCGENLGGLNLFINEVVSPQVPVLILTPTFNPSQINLSTRHIELAIPPFNATEVVTRLKILDARAKSQQNGNLIRHGDLTIDQHRYEVSIAGEKIDLTYKEYELLRYMADRPGRVFSRESLLRSVWDYDYFGGTRTVDVHIRRLRSKIDSTRHQFIETIWNVGYRFRGTD